MKMQHIIKRVAWLGVIAGLATFNMAARADLLFYEGFDYAVGSDLDGAHEGSSGFSGNWGNANGCIIGGGLSFGSLENIGGAATKDGGWGQPKRWLTTPIDSSSDIVTSGGSIYISFLIYQEEKDFVNLAFFNEGGEQLGIGSILNIQGWNSSDYYSFNIAGSISNYAASNIPIDVNSTHLLLMQLDYSDAGQTKFSLFFDPVSRGDIAVATYNFNDVLSFNHIRLELNGGGFIDEIRMATTLDEALPGLFAVPEPSTWALLLMSGGLLLALRRRKS